jgi:hypothetical protein
MCVSTSACCECECEVCVSLRYRDGERGVSTDRECCWLPKAPRISGRNEWKAGGELKRYDYRKEDNVGRKIACLRL